MFTFINVQPTRTIRKHVSRDTLVENVDFLVGDVRRSASGGWGVSLVTVVTTGDSVTVAVVTTGDSVT